MYQTLTLTKPNGLTWIFHYVTMVEFKKFVLFVWQDSAARPVTVVNPSEYISFKLEVEV